MARVTYVKAARKDQDNCGRCGDEIKKGDSYRHASPGFRSSKKVRCMKAECNFRQSELTTSKMGEVYAAQEDAEDTITNVTALSDITDALNECADRCEEVASEYREAAEAMGEAGAESEERADEIDSYCDSLRDFDITQYEADEDDQDQNSEEDLLEEAKEAAREELSTL